MKRILLALLFVLALGSNARAWTVVAHACASQSGGGDGSDLTSTGVDTNGANLLVLYSSDYFGSTGLTVSDSRSNTWNGLTNVAGTSSNGRLWYAFGPTVGATHTFTISTGGTLFNGAFCVMAVSGSLSSDPFDVQSTNSNTSSATIATGSITPSMAGELVVTGFGSAASGNTPAIDSSFTLVDSVIGAGHDLVGLAYITQGAASAVNPTWTTDAAVNNVTSIASFKAPSTTAKARRRPIILQ